MQTPANYKTSASLLKATIKAHKKLDGAKLYVWVRNAKWVAENMLNDCNLAQQITDIQRAAAFVSCTFDTLVIAA